MTISELFERAEKDEDDEELPNHSTKLGPCISELTRNIREEGAFDINEEVASKMR